MTFVADCMLGKLAKWLRALGFDALCFRRIGDDELLNIAIRQSRTLLTRDEELYRRASRVPRLLVLSERWEEQIVQVLRAFGLSGEIAPYSRCLECNRQLKSLDRENARNLVTPFVFDRAESFSLCPECGRVFWKGTHSDDMGAKIASILNEIEKEDSLKKA